MAATSHIPRAIRSLPSPSPSVAFQSTASSVTNADDVSVPSLQIPSDPPHTLSPPESLLATEDSSEFTSLDALTSQKRDSAKKVIGASRFSDTIVVRPKGKGNGNYKTYASKGKGKCSRKDRPISRKRLATDDDDDCGPQNIRTSYSPPKKRARVVGLKNLGNTCYNNAVIQALSHTGPLREFFLERRFSLSAGSEEIAKREDLTAQVRSIMTRPRTRGAAKLEEQIVIPTNVNLCDEFSRLLRLMWLEVAPEGPSGSRRSRARQSTGSTVVSPHEFANAVAAVLPFFHKRHEQQDAQEFLRCALERIQDELATEKLPNSEDLVDGATAVEDTIVQIVFGGVLWNKIVCLACSKYTIKPDPFLDLSLVIPESSSVSTCKAGDNQDPVTLEDCLDLFSSAEELEGSPSPPASSSSSSSGLGRSCMSCGSDTGFSKALKFGVLPQVLCIHLKRFRWRTAVRGGKQKVDTHVKFPMEGLDMERWIGGDVSSPSLYDLYAVVVHQGSGVNSGHYYAFTKFQDEWYCLNDDRTSKVSAESVAKVKAYLLFYKRREGNEGGPRESHKDEGLKAELAH